MLLAVFTVAGFVFGLAFDNIFTKANANEPSQESLLPNETAFELTAAGSARSADYEIVNIYGRKYIIFKSGGDIEVLEY